MGGAIVTQFMERSRLASRVAGLVLDAPVLDWKHVLSFNATEMGFPALVATPLEWAIGARIDADWDSLNALSHPRDFHLPILLFHGGEDDVVPLTDSDDFAALLPRWVTYYRVPRAGHTEAWNVDPGLYERRLGAFLAQEIGGRASAQGRSASSCAPSETSVASSLGRATIITERGRPLSVKPAGIVAAGWPV
jgi:alpha-beta hydrolase superfamily lysophospholipase